MTRSAGGSPTVPATVREALARAAAALSAAGVDAPRLDAELLLGEVLGVDRGGLVLRARDPVDGGALGAFDALVARRVAREPVAYILGRRGFRRLSIAVDRRVLIPRPETELLVEVGLELPAGARVADVGTGSGAVALALADERPDLRVSGLDISPDALAVARENAARLGLDICWTQTDLLDARGYDAVLANLPYVEDGAVLAPESATYEPASALFAGVDGLDAVRRLVAVVAPRDDVELIALEIGAGQAGEVEALVSSGGFGAVSRRRDLAGHDRVIVGRR
jgi:release factor glutamine methyltransferase